jgi:class III lanthionine synthetase
MSARGHLQVSFRTSETIPPPPRIGHSHFQPDPHPEEPMIPGASFLLADEDFYRPLAAGAPGRRYEPAIAPDGWTMRRFDVWTMWTPDGVRLPEQGWKVHVSATLTNSARVLDVVAGVCHQRRIPFKHLTGRNYFIGVHGKHSSRQQSGKFCAIYPSTPELAHATLEALSAEFQGISGPYVLTDRRYGDSECVSYRFGSFTSRSRVEADGTRTPLVVAVDGELVPDERRPEFVLPKGIADPFRLEPTASDTLDEQSGEVSFHGYTFEKVLQYSNAGGAYRARCADGRRVFIKEARAHNGYIADGSDAADRLAQEFLILRAIDALSPGLCPRPIALFRHWENTFLVTEFVAGKTLVAWAVEHTPVIRVGAPPATFAEFYRRCQDIVAQLRATLGRLHAAGYAFVDLSPRNVLIDEHDRARLVDFESAQRTSEPVRTLATPGFFPPQARDPELRAGIPAEHCDDYALAAIVQHLLFPLHETVLRNPQAAGHLLADLAEPAPVPEALRAEMTRFLPAPTARLPAPERLRADPLHHLADLRDRTADALIAMAGDAERAGTEPLFPTVPDGYQSNASCLAWGAAGVLHALRASGRPVPPAWTRRLRDDALAAPDTLPPGLAFGTAGIGWVLADLGEVDAAGELLRAAGSHPLLDRSATLGGGAAGLALGLMRHYRVTGDGTHLEHAASLLDRLPQGSALVPLLGADDASGLLSGRVGVALALYYLARLTGQDEPLDRGIALLREELVHALPYESGGIGFRVSTKDNRSMPYLATGSAGYARVAARYLTVRHVGELADVLERCLRTLGVRFTVSSGLFNGQAGFALTLAELAVLLDRPELRRQALGSALALVKHCIPHETGVRWLGQHNQRFSADLSSGSAGVLLALHQVLEPATDPLFTLDTGLPAPGAVAHARESQ